MRIPLGIIASSGRRAGGSYELIETITVGSTSVSSVTFSNLNTYASTYEHLQVRIVANSSANSSIKFRLNNDSAGNYALHALYGQGSSVLSLNGVNENAMYAGYTYNQPYAAVIDLLDPYSTTKNKTSRCLTGTTSGSGNFIFLTSSHWRSLNAVSSLLVYNESGNFTNGSRFSIYGLKAS